jgi:RNA polymerase sigma factor (sigma-70 family)
MVSMNLEKLSGKARGAAAGRPKWVQDLLGSGYVAHRSFASPRAEEQLFGPESLSISVPAWTQFPEAGDEEAVSPAARRPALSGREEAALFLRYNYARLRVARILARHGGRPGGRDFGLWYGRMMDGKESLARANMALVVAMAKRTRTPNCEFTELVSEGNMALLRSIEKFDVSRGFKFSTYACRSILKSFNRLATKTARYRRLFPTEFDPELERSDQEVRKREIERRDSLEELHDVLGRNRAGLSLLERRVVRERFAVGGKADRVRTLAEVGHVVGLTNERVRQIQNSALTKLRAVMAGGGLGG